MAGGRKRKSCAKKKKSHADDGEAQKIQFKSLWSRLPLPLKFQIHQVMTFSEIKTIVGTSDVKIKSSSFRYSELYALVEKVATYEKGILTIVVEDGTLNYSEINTLSTKGGRYVSFDLTGY